MSIEKLNDNILLAEKEYKLLQVENEERNNTVNEFLASMNDLCAMHEKTCKI